MPEIKKSFIKQSVENNLGKVFGESWGDIFYHNPPEKDKYSLLCRWEFIGDYYYQSLFRGKPKEKVREDDINVLYTSSGKESIEDRLMNSVLMIGEGCYENLNAILSHFSVPTYCLFKVSGNMNDKESTIWAEQTGARLEKPPTHFIKDRNVFSANYILAGKNGYIGGFGILEKHVDVLILKYLRFLKTRLSNLPE